ncbi:hypothetical protein VCB98_11450 [Gammaproteobacteria bacterium AB-CW1]|uniref:DUF1579 domain-containing protein n=2 Tax=Natronospira TaxID=2024969 RepID=A0AAP6JG82_9GAMM|nr:hypothetical protein [Gammaproteobacteria bacterium AB-CW1]
MKQSLLVLMFLAFLLPTHALACRGDVVTVMDYMAGDWMVADQQGNVLGYSEIREGAGGCAIRERWQGQDGLEGEAMFTARDGGERWRMVWSDSDGLMLELDGQRQNGNMVFTGAQESDQGQILHRIVYELLFEIGEIHQRWEYSTDGGRRWQVFFAGWYLPDD